MPGVLILVTMLQFGIGGAVLPFIAFHLVDEGFSFGQIGRIFFVGSTSSLVFPFLWGYLSDRYIPLDRLFVVLNILTGVALILLHQSESLLSHQVVFAGYYAFYHPTLMLINSLCFHHLKNPPAEFGKARALGSLGWILPSIPLFLIYFYLPEVSTGICLYFAAGIAFLSGGLCLVLPHTETEKSRARNLKSIAGDASANKEVYSAQLWKLLKDSRFICLMVSLFFAAASFSILAFYSTPYLEELGVARAWAGPIQSIGVVAEVILMPFLPLFFARYGYVNALMFGLGCLVLRHMTAWFFDQPVIFSLLYILVGLMVIYYYTVVSMALDRLAHKAVRSTAQTFMVILGSGLGPMMANFFSGMIADNTESDSLKPIFGFGLVLSIISIAILLPIYRSLKQFLDVFPVSSGDSS